jgi:sec-independent protein translocase protein TatB
MFGLAWPEVLLIGAVAVLAIGPKDLPVVMRTAGKWSRRARLMLDDFKKHWDDLPRQADLLDMQKQADDLQRKTFESFNVDLTAIEKSYADDTENGAPKPVRPPENEKKHDA